MTGHAALPYGVSDTGLTATVPDETYLAQLLEQIVFVQPGERVNRPDFGCNMRGLTFASGHSEIIGAVSTLVQSALRQWVGGAVEVLDVDVRMVETRAHVTITYRDKGSGTARRIVLTGKGLYGGAGR